MATHPQDREQEFHDRLYARGDHVRGPAAKFYTAAGGAYDFYEEQLRQLAPGRHVLEYGCGPGSYSFFLARNGAEVTGVDISPVAIERARETARLEGVDGRTSFAAMDCENLDFEDGTFDIVCGEGIIHHVDVAKAYREISRVLKVDGTAVFLEPLGHNPLINAYRRRTPEIRTPDEHPLLIADLEMASQFFHRVDTRFFTLLSLAAVPLRNSRSFVPIATRLDRLDRRLFDRVPWARKHAWMATLSMREPAAKVTRA
jgi:SAM-dependent methyltransferase